MASKSLLLLSLLLATFLIAATARDLAEKTEEKNTKEGGGLGDQKYPYGGGYGFPGRGGGYPGGGYGGYPGGGGGGYGGYPGGGGGFGGYGHGGGYCRFGCCGRGYYGGCRYCCPYPGAETEAEPGN